MVRICLINSVLEDPRTVELHEQVKNAPKLDDPFEEERRLAFTVISCSSQDDDFAATELSKGVSGRGWQTRRFCIYPQELVIELQWPSYVFTMQLLCHEYKISSKVEIFASVLANGQINSQMKRLGHLSLDPNERTGFQARELKSIQINAPATVIRLVVHTCYSNKLNVYNQVGIVALVVTGEPLSQEQIIKHQLGFATPSESPNLHPMPKPRVGVDLSSVDSTTAQRIQRLQHEKGMAVQEEDYDEAKRLKILIGRLRTLGEQIKQLEIKKKMAVEEEDYDQAKLCKLEIEKLRQVNAETPEDESSIFTTSRSEEFCGHANLGDKTQKSSENVGSASMYRESCDSSTQTSELVSDDEFGEVLIMPNDNADVYTKKENLDAYQSSSVQLDASDEIVYAKSKDVVAEAQGSSSEEVLSPEPLSEAALKEFSDVLTVMDQYHLECLLSKQWQLRDKALQFLEKELELKRCSDEAVVSFRAIYKVLVPSFKDRVSNVFFSSIQVFRAYVSKYAAEVPNRELHSCVGDIVSILLEKLGDSNARTREASGETLMFLAEVKEVGLTVISPLMLKVPKTLSLWKPILGRLHWLLSAIPKFGLQTQNRSGFPGFPSEALMHFVVHCFHYPNGEVRNAAMKVTTEVYKIMGLAVEKYLKGVKPMIREIIVGLFEKSGEGDSFASSSHSKVTSLKANGMSESSNQIKLPDPSANGNLIMGSSQARGQYADRFAVAQASAGRSSSFEGGSSGDFTQVHKVSASSSGKPSCSALRR